MKTGFEKEIFNNYMQIAIDIALTCNSEEIPVGCVIVDNETGKILAKSGNKTKKKRNPIMHAEIICINKALKKLNKDRLTNCSMYVTMEPCKMCAGAIILAKIEKLYIGCLSEKTGAIISNRSGVEKCNYKTKVFYPIMGKECSDIVVSFFKKKRK